MPSVPPSIGCHTNTEECESLPVPDVMSSSIHSSVPHRLGRHRASPGAGVTELPPSLVTALENLRVPTGRAAKHGRRGRQESQLWPAAAVTCSSGAENLQELMLRERRGMSQEALRHAGEVGGWLETKLDG